MLTYWSNQITNQFKEANVALLASHDGKVTTTLQSFTDSMNAFAERLSRLESSVAQAEGNARLIENEKKLKAEVKYLLHHLETQTEKFDNYKKR